MMGGKVTVNRSATASAGNAAYVVNNSSSSLTELRHVSVEDVLASIESSFIIDEAMRFRPNADVAT